ncbi:hypothetical protein Lser_V15G02948 [Lactuca serriola]
MMTVLSEFLEGSSSSSHTHGLKHDVFLSFRGCDTRHSFTNHLHKALIAANITVFFDDDEIKTGEDLKPELESAIKASRASIIILSKNYADSSWCLDELLLILEQRRTSNQIVIPIFYHVEPTHIRKQESTFGIAMAKHRQQMETQTNANKKSQMAQKISRWSRALTKVANLSGENVKGWLEAEFIDEIVKDICRRLQIPLRNGMPQLIGMNNSIKFVTSWLKDDSSYTGDILTILGMSGIGKTSLAKYVYWSNFREFDTSSYIEDISRRCVDKYNGLHDLQKQLCGDITKTSPTQFHYNSICTSQIENAIENKKVFLVLDNVDSVQQLDALLGSRGFQQGSKIILTTNDAWLTKSCALFKTNVKPKHAKHLLQGLCETGSRELLCFHAFMCKNPNTGFEEVLENILTYCGGHPLALEVLGKSLYNRDVAYWEECIKGLKKEIGSHINNVLRMSFDSLPSENDKDLFKHIACFFVGMDRDVTETILKACAINTRVGITNLIDRCMLSVGENNKLMMHQLLRDMGRFVVRQESLEKPWKRSRLWCHEESFKVLKQKKGKGNLLGLALDMRMLENEKLRSSFKLKTDVLGNMDNLMLLQLNYVQIDGSYDKFPEELRWLCMHGFPLKTIPSDLQMENLVALDMSYSNIQSFGICDINPRLESRNEVIGSSLNDKMSFESLKILNLSFCEQLHIVSGFGELPALERLILTNCIGLLVVCESIEQCVKLVLVDLSYCNKLENQPRTISMLNNVKTLLLEGCNLSESQFEIRDIDPPKIFNVNNIVINAKTSPSSILGAIPSDFKFVASFLSRSLVKLSLAKNNLSTESFPIDFSCLPILEELYLDENPIVSLPNCVRSLPRLKKLSLENCKYLKSVEYPPHTLRKLILYSSHISSLRRVALDPEIRPLKLSVYSDYIAPLSFEFEGMVKLQPIVSVGEKALHSLGWKNLDFLNEMRVGTHFWSKRAQESQIQMYYEFGIFSTIYGGQEMPNWIRRRSKQASISFTIPSSRNKVRGLNFCCIHKVPFPEKRILFPNEEFRYLPMITLHNITKKRTWVYNHYVYKVNVGGDCQILLSHWMFGMDEMERGDQITVIAKAEVDQIIKECGVKLVYDDGSTNEDEDPLDYYKSWNHINGGDLSAFEIIKGAYFLHNTEFMMNSQFNGIYRSYQNHDLNYDPSRCITMWPIS